MKIRPFSDRISSDLNEERHPIQFSLMTLSRRGRPVTGGLGTKFCNKITNWHSGFVPSFAMTVSVSYEIRRGRVGEERGEGRGGEGGEGGEGLPKAEADEQVSTSTTDWPGEKKTGLTGPFFPDITL